MGYSRDPLDGRDAIAQRDASDDAREDRPDEMSSEQNTGMRALSDLDDLVIADGEPDIRGWSVRTGDGVQIGEVADLIIDTAAMKVRYMCVDLDQTIFNLDGKRRVLVPIGTARLDDDGDDVFIRSSTSQLLTLPEYDDAAFTLDANDPHELFGRPWMTGQTASADDNLVNTLDRNDLYHQDQFSDREFFGARRRDREDQSYLRRQDSQRAAPPPLRDDMIDESR